MFRFKGQQHELPKKTMAINEIIEKINKSTSTSESYANMLNFVIMGLGEEKVIELLGTIDLYDIDLTELNILSNAIVQGYELAIYKEQEEYLNKIANNKAIKSVIDVGKSAEVLNKINK